MLNQMHDFSKAAGGPRRRSTFSLPFEHKFTGNEGALMPFYCMEVLPGDTFNVRTNYVCRMLQTPVKPVMDNAYLDIYYFYVPSRILWKNWELFCGRAEPSQYTAPVTYTLPQVDFNNQAVVSGSVANLMGLPIGFNGTANALPFAAYIMIWNEWFRDQNVQNSNSVFEQIYDLASGATIAAPTMGMYVAGFNQVNSVCKYHDLFTSSLPDPNKEGSVPISSALVPILGDNSVIGVGSLHKSGLMLFGYDNSGSPAVVSSNAALTAYNGYMHSTDTDSSVAVPHSLEYNNLVADMSQGDTIDALRQAIALDNYRKRLALGGSRYTELLKSMFGVSPTDSRLDRPEYLGGSHKRLNMQQVATTAGAGTPGSAASTDTGNLGAYSVTGDSNGSFIKSFDEYGYVIGLCAVRVKHSYAQGLPRKFTKTGRFDFFWPQFDRMGEVPVATNEIYWQSGNTDTFGFQEAWYEYRYTPDRVSGAITPGQSADLTAWTYGDVYAAKPTLSTTWIQEDNGRLQQTLAGTSSMPQLVFDFFVDNKATRPMSLNSVPSSLGM